MEGCRKKTQTSSIFLCSHVAPSLSTCSASFPSRSSPPFPFPHKQLSLSWHRRPVMSGVCDECMSLCVCWAAEGIITVFILWPSVWPSQRAPFFRLATIGRWLPGLGNIWITWMSAFPPPLRWQTAKMYADRWDTRVKQKLLRLRIIPKHFWILCFCVKQSSEVGSNS